MKPPEEIAREIANGAVKFDWNTGSAGFHTRRAMIQTYIFNVPVRLIPGENEDVVVAKFEKWAEPIRGRIATTLAVLVRAAISAERAAGTVPPAPAPGDLAHEPSCIHAKNGSTGMIDARGRCAFCTPTKKENTR